MTAHDVLLVLLAGVLAAGYAVAALFFLHFWKQSKDRLFAYFAAAFALLTVQRVALAFSVALNAGTFWYYVLRLIAFLLILVAIIDKNRAGRA